MRLSGWRNVLRRRLSGWRRGLSLVPSRRRVHRVWDVSTAFSTICTLSPRWHWRVLTRVVLLRLETELSLLPLWTLHYLRLLLT